jgi:hypothetical protein
MGWIDEGGLKGRDKGEVARFAHQCARSAENDLHWHVYTEDTLRETICFAALCSGRSVSFRCVAAPYKDDERLKTASEIIVVYEISSDRSLPPDGSLLRAIDGSRAVLLRALETLDRVKKSGSK